MLLEASLSREALAEEGKRCRNCNKNVWAIWRCRDCFQGSPMCRQCFRLYHRENPFHRIERWNGNFFQPAELFEVGIHLLVRHHAGEHLCETLTAQQRFLEILEMKKDDAEQEKINSKIPAPSPGPSPAYMSSPATDVEMESENEMTPQQTSYEKKSDEQFFRYLNNLRDDCGEQSMEGNEQEVEDEVEEEEEEPIENEYIAQIFEATNDTGPGPSTFAGLPSAIVGNYVRVVHTNGIHNIAMLTCNCGGEDSLPCKLVAAGLLPASFKRIRTLFTTQLLDHFRLCNLELKASAYQFYHLLQRLTNPMAPMEVVNLYREFRRMSRIWRWMKRLKWAGISHSGKKVSDVPAGQLTVFCPACPQPGINIPDDWKDDKNRSVFQIICYTYLYKY